MRYDVLIIHEPAQELVCAMGRVIHQPLRFPTEVNFGAVEHGLGGCNLIEVMAGVAATDQKTQNR
jgi:hypothetical protein